MNDITLTSTHLKTLAELAEIAKKHDCYINIGHKVNSEQYKDIEDLEDLFSDVAVFNELCEKYSADSVITITTANYWFELSSAKEHRVVGLLNCTTARIEGKIVKNNKLEETSNDLDEWLEENTIIDCFDDYDSPTISIGKQENLLHCDFAGKKVDCYREGICVREFGNLICDYFGEPRIERVY